MSFGFHRDSLANLLAHTHQDNNVDGNNNLSGQSHHGEVPLTNESDDNAEEYFFFDANGENDIPATIPVVISQSRTINDPPKSVDESTASVTSSAKTRETANTAKLLSKTSSEKNGAKTKKAVSAVKNDDKRLNYGDVYHDSYDSWDYGDYTEYGGYYADSYAVASYGGNYKKKNPFCCFFPALNESLPEEDDYEEISDNTDSSNDQFEDVDSSVSTSLHEDVDANLNRRGDDAIAGTSDQSDSNNSKSDMLYTAPSHIVDDDEDNHASRIVVRDIDDIHNAGVSNLAPNNPRVLNHQRTDSFSTAQSIPSSWSSPSSQGKSSQNAGGVAGNSAAVSSPTENKNKTSIVKKRIPVADAKPLKGILKRTSDVNLTLSSKIGKGKEISVSSDAVPSRRHLFPTYQPRTCAADASSSSAISGTNDKIDRNASNKVKKGVKFQPMSRVVTVKSRESMTFMERCQIWWQKPDYDDFKKAARIIAKAMVEGGSEIWLQTSESWNKQKQLKQQQNCGTSVDTTTTNSRSYISALKKHGVVMNESDLSSSDGTAEEKESFGDKWWCKFGHSRRGLEHIVSVDEGRQRHKHVMKAIHAVLDEQRRQRSQYSITRDPEKIASVSRRHTSWARELAFATGAADDEAVHSNFCTNAKCRVRHLHDNLKMRDQIVKTDDNGGNGYKSAHFILTANPALTSLILDENTSSSLTRRNSYRNKTSKRNNAMNSLLSTHEYHRANLKANERINLTKAASGFGSPTTEDVTLLRYQL